MKVVRLFALLFACVALSTLAAAAAPPKNVTVAFVLSMTGTTRGVMYSANRAYYFALKALEDNKNLLIPNTTVNIVTLDPSNSPSKAIRLVTQTYATWNEQSEAPLVAVLGDFGSAVTTPLAHYTASLRIPHISYSAADPSLEDKVLYPTFLRTTANDGYHVAAIISMCRMYGWKRLAVLFSDDSFARAFYNSLMKNLPKDIMVVGYPFLSSKFDAVYNNSMNIMATIAKTDFRVVYMHSLPDSSPGAITAAYDSGLLNNPRWTWVVGAWKADVLPGQNVYFPDYDRLTNIWKGVLSIHTAYPPHPKIDVLYRYFLNRNGTNNYFLPPWSPGPRELTGYDMMYCLLVGMNTLYSSTDANTPENLYLHVRNQNSFGGGNIQFNENGERINIIGLGNYDSATDDFTIRGRFNDTSRVWEMNSQVIWIDGTKIAPPDTPGLVPQGGSLSYELDGRLAVVAVVAVVFGTWTSLILLEQGVTELRMAKDVRERIWEILMWSVFAAFADGICGLWSMCYILFFSLTVQQTTLWLTPGLCMAALSLCFVLAILSNASSTFDAKRSIAKEKSQNVETSSTRPSINGSLLSTTLGSQKGSLIKSDNASHTSRENQVANNGNVNGNQPNGDANSNSNEANSALSETASTIVQYFMLYKKISPLVLLSSLIKTASTIGSWFIVYQGCMVKAVVSFQSVLIFCAFLVSWVLTTWSELIAFHYFQSHLRITGAFFNAGGMFATHCILFSSMKFNYDPYALDGLSSSSYWTDQSSGIIVCVVSCLLCLTLLAFNIVKLSMNRAALNTLVENAENKIKALKTSLKKEQKSTNGFQRFINISYSILNLINYARPLPSLSSIAYSLTYNITTNLRQKRLNRTASTQGNKASSEDGSSGEGQGLDVKGNAGFTFLNNAFDVPALHNKDMDHYQANLNTLKQLYESSDKASALTRASSLANPAARTNSITSSASDTDVQRLRTILSHPYTLELIKDKLMDIHCEESLLCWLDLQVYAQIDNEQSRRFYSQELMSQYIEEDSPFQVNISATMRQQCLKRYAVAPDDPKLFVDVDKELVSLIHTNVGAKEELNIWKLYQCINQFVPYTSEGTNPSSSGEAPAMPRLSTHAADANSVLNRSTTMGSKANGSMARRPSNNNNNRGSNVFTHNKVQPV